MSEGACWGARKFLVKGFRRGKTRGFIGFLYTAYDVGAPWVGFCGFGLEVCKALGFHLLRVQGFGAQGLGVQVSRNWSLPASTGHLHHGKLSGPMTQSRLAVLDLGM